MATRWMRLWSDSLNFVMNSTVTNFGLVVNWGGSDILYDDVMRRRRAKRRTTICGVGDEVVAIRRVVPLPVLQRAPLDIRQSRAWQYAGTMTWTTERKSAVCVFDRKWMDNAWFVQSAKRYPEALDQEVLHRSVVSRLAVIYSCIPTGCEPGYYPNFPTVIPLSFP